MSAIGLWTALASAALGGPPAERGMALGLFSADPAFDYAPLIAEVAALGASHLALAVVWWQDDLAATQIGPVPSWSATDRQVVAAIRAARSAGLHTTLFPIVRLRRADRGEWRGRLAPADEDAWWASYGAMIDHMADLAVDGGAQRLSIGSELLSRERMRDRWLTMIDRLRVAAPALELMYSANWDHYLVVTFWDAVDVVSLTGYFELTKSYHASAAELTEAWRPIRASLERFSREVGRPIVISEVGYPSIDGAAVWPWDQTRKAAIDLEEQRRAYHAFAAAWSGASLLQGVYFWNWFGFGGAQDGDYTPRGKPAAEVVRRWYRAGAGGARPLEAAEGAR